MEQVIINYIIDEFHGGDASIAIAADDDLLGSGLVESMSMMRLITFLEETYQFKLPFQDMTIDNFETVNAMVAYIKKQNKVTPS
ncbi:MAG: acyl carrier protein [Bacteroidota bacterium]